MPSLQLHVGTECIQILVRAYKGPVLSEQGLDTGPSCLRVHYQAHDTRRSPGDSQELKSLG